MAGNRLRGAKDQDAAGDQRIVEDRDHPVLQSAVQIDQQIAAGDQVDPGERRIADQAVRRERAKLADPLPDHVAAGAFDNEPGTPFGGQAFQQRRRDNGRRERWRSPTSSMSLAKICTLGSTGNVSICSRTSMASE